MTSESFYEVGDEFHYRRVADAVDPYEMEYLFYDTSGEDQVWDFSAMNSTGVEDFWAEAVIPSTAPGFSSMTDADHCVLEHFDSGDRYSFYHLSSTEYSRVGSYGGALPVANVYTDPQQELIFPLSVGTENVDEWQSNSLPLALNYSIDCVASGEITLPDGVGTYSNTYLVRIIVGGIPSQVFYHWYSASGLPVCIYYPGNDLSGSAPYISYLHSTTVGLDDEDIGLPLSLNTLVEEKLHIRSNGQLSAPVNYRILDLGGRSIHEGRWNPIESDRIIIHMDDIPSGTYLFNAWEATENRTSTYKLIKL